MITYDYYRIFYYVAQYKSLPRQQELFTTISQISPAV